MKELISAFAKEKSIVIGVCGVEKLSGRACGGNVPFIYAKKEKRLNPALGLPGAKSVIVAAVPYSRNPIKTDNADRGTIAAFAVGVDYHVRVKNLLNELAERMKQKAEFCHKIFSDTGPLPERELAEKSGVGCFGKNKNIITREYGSYVNLGYMLTDIELSPDKAHKKDVCAGCELCLIACPGGALSDISVPLNHKKCISYISQCKDALSAEQKRLMGSHIYGCDICQSVCPHNSKLSGQNDYGAAYPLLDELLLLDNDGFQKKYADSTLAWIGYDTFIRNVKIAKEYFNHV